MKVYFQLDQLRVEYQVPHFTMATFFVTKPGNLSDPNRLYRMNKFVDDLEHINGSWGAVGTQYFVRDFINFENSFEGIVFSAFWVFRRVSFAVFVFNSVYRVISYFEHSSCHLETTYVFKRSI